jgi:dsRNA-specific ribonuclease
MGTGSSKKAAEQEAARETLEKLGIEVDAADLAEPV